MTAGFLKQLGFLLSITTLVKSTEAKGGDPYMRIGELLVMNALITSEQLEQALHQQRHIHKKLGEILIENGLINERQLAEALEFQLGVPVVHLDETSFDPNTVDLIPETMARKYGIIPIERKGGKIIVAMNDPLNYQAIKEVQLAAGMSVQPFIATRTEIEQAIIQNYGVMESLEELNEIIQFGVEHKASDIHLAPSDNGLAIKYRIDNALRTERTVPLHKQRALIERIKMMSNIDTAERRLPQVGRMQKQIDHKNIEIRVSTLPAVNGESIVLRIINHGDEMRKIADLGFSEANLAKLEKAIQRADGMVVVCGPAVSGKSSTLYSILHQLKREELKIITVEDPMDRRMPEITQVEVNERIGLTFAYGLQSVLLQDPNIVMIGEIRDAETVKIAARASRSGRFVISGIDENNAVSTIKRLASMSMDSYMLSAAISSIVAQRLVRRVCDQCAQAAPVSDEEMKLFETYELLHPDDQKITNKSIIGNFRTFVTAHMSGKMTVIRGSGCKLCNNTGYRGLLAIQEVLIVDDSLRKLIIQNASYDELEQHLKQCGFKTMLYDGLLKAREGMTTVEEVLKAVH
jgi:type IV pilus assembly protein PilB